MKIVNHYDLMDRVNETNRVIDFKKIVLTELKRQLLIFPAVVGLELAVSTDKQIKLLLDAAICTGCFSVAVITSALHKLHFRDVIQCESYMELARLALRLARLNIKTSPNLLMDAEVSQVDYKIIMNEKKLPIIEQNKYILIPTYNSLGAIESTSLLQEHNMGSKEYILSIESPEKATRLVPTFGV